MRAERLKTVLWEAALLCGGCMTAIMSTLLSPALSNIKKDFPGVSQTTVKLVLTIPSLTLAIASPLTGLMITYGVSYRVILLLSAPLYALFGVIPYWVDDLTGIIVLRAFFGIFAGACEATSTVLLTVLENRMDPIIRTRSVLYGVRAGVMSTTGFLCSLVGGALADSGWRNIFFIHFVGLLYIIGYIFLPKVNIQKHTQTNTKEVPSQEDVESKLVVSDKPEKEDNVVDESSGDNINHEAIARAKVVSEVNNTNITINQQGLMKTDLAAEEAQASVNSPNHHETNNNEGGRGGRIIGVIDSLGIDDSFLSGLMSGGSVLASGLASLLYPVIWKPLQKSIVGPQNAGSNDHVSMIVAPHLATLIIATAPMAIGFAGLVLSKNYWPAWISGTILVGMFNGLNMPNCNMWGSRVASKKWISTVIGTVTSLTFLAHFVTPFVLDYLPGTGGEHTRYGFLLCSIMMFVCALAALIIYIILTCKKPIK